MTTILLKRSATPADAPTTGQMSLGEVAVNTYDGKLFARIDDGAAGVVEFHPFGSPLPAYTLTTLPTVVVGVLINVTNTTASPGLCIGKGSSWIDVFTGVAAA